MEPGPGCWSKDTVHIGELFASTIAIFPACCPNAAPVSASSAKHQSLSLCQKLEADQESLAQLGQQVRDSGSPHASRWFSQSILTRRESTCSCPQFHTSSLSLTLLHPMASYLEGMTLQALLGALGKNMWEGTSSRSTPGRASPSEVNNSHQTMPPQGVSNQILGRRL